MPARLQTPFSWLLAALILIGGVTVPWSEGAVAVPATPEIESARESAVEAREALDELQADLEESTEEYLEIEAEITETRERIAVTERELSTALAELDESERRLNRRADAMYRTGPADFLSVFVGATDFRDFVTRLDMMRLIGRNDAGLVEAVKDAKTRIESSKTALERRHEEQVVLRERARGARTRMKQTVKRQEAFIARLDAELKQLVAEERERQERLARERAEAAAQARLAAQPGTGQAGRPFVASALGSSHPEVVEVAKRFVDRTWYRWGGVTPAGFDCSGLVLYCYREVGVYLPRTSRQQYRVGAYIPPDRLDLLQPGDLVFFGREGDPARIHHVGIYSGGGNMIHAPQTGERVSVSSLTGRIAARGDYVGAVRP